MNRFAYILLPLLVSLSSLGTVQYDVWYKLGQLNTRVATADISWEEASWNGIPAYHSKALIQPTPFFRLFISSDYIAESWCRESDLVPLFFTNPFKNGKCDYLYPQDEDDDIEATLVFGSKEPAYLYFPNDGKTMDLLTLLHFVRFVNQEQLSTPLQIHTLITGKSFPAELIYLGEDPDKIPGIPCENFLLRMTERGLMENGSGNEIYIWRSSGEDRRILCLETELSTGSMAVRIQQ